MIKKIYFLLGLLIIPIKALALIEVDITRGNLNPLPLAVSPLSIDDKSKKSFEKILSKKNIGSEISIIVENNLKTSGLFNPLSKEAFLQAPDIANLKPRFEDWALIKAQALITGKVTYVEEKLRSILDKTKIVRLDSDSIAAYGSEQRLHNAIKSADIIIGTKKVLDIYDLKHVTYLCLLLPEYHNNEYDYKYNERIFQFIMEASDIIDGTNPLNKLVVQALNPNNEVIHLALQRKIDEFYSKELEWRSIYEYPPLVQLFKFEFSHIDGSYAAEEANRLYRLLKKTLINKDIKIFGPIKLNNDMINNKYRWTIYVKGNETSAILQDVDIPFGWQVELNPDNIA